ncbi:MAG: glycosyltransferase family 4 protein [Chloroflexi bacterium]|nr:glycosyltransferase family 4 protein [Chloroflexota bacterium]
MRVAINGSFWHKTTTGSGQYVRELVSAMAQSNRENDYVLIVPEGESTRAHLRVLDDISPRTFLYPESVALARYSENLAKVWFEQRVFGRVCRRERADLAHVPYFGSPLFPATRTVVTIHDLIPMLLPLYRGSPFVRLYTALAAASARRADAIIADSECTKRDIVRRLKIPEERVRVVYLAASARYRPIEDVAAVRAKYALPDRYLLYLGGFDQRKNVRVIIEAFALLPELYRERYRLALAGVSLGNDSAFFPDPRRIAQEVGLPEDAIRYVGGVLEEDKPALYSGATLFLYSSLYEGFGLQPLEAMACGAPVIASNASSLPEIIGDAGLAVDPSSPIAWAEALRAVVGDAARRDAMRAQGMAQAAKFSWARAAEETWAVYRSAMGG